LQLQHFCHFWYCKLVTYTFLIQVWHLGYIIWNLDQNIGSHSLC
jgi:hypothetical protein